MSYAVCIESRTIAEELYLLLRLLDSSQWRVELEQVHQQLQDLSVRLRDAVESPDFTKEREMLSGLQEKLQTLAHLVREARPDGELTAKQLKEHWNHFRAKTVPAYEALVANLRLQDIHLPSLRPTNYNRNIFHVTSAVVVFLLLQHVPQIYLLPWIAGAFTLWAWSMEIGRRFNPRLNDLLMAAFGKMAHPHEHYRVNSATWYASALYLMSLAIPHVSFGLLAAGLGVLVLGFGDPSAAIIGRRFGRIKIRSGRTLEGTLAFVVIGSIISLVGLSIYTPQLAFSQTLVVAVAGATFGAIAELFSQRLDDNFTIPLSVMLGSVLTFMVLGF